MEDFKEIAHTGGKIEVKANGTLRLSHCKACAAAWFQIAVTYHGIPIAYIPMGGIGHRPKFPKGTFPAYIASDKEGFFGRYCPACGNYFRSKSTPANGYCPYCGMYLPNLAFTTTSQKEFIDAYMNVLRQVIETGKDQVIDIDEIIDGIQNNASPFAYPEEHQQTHIKCGKCGTEFDIRGVFGFCHYCGRRNSLQTFAKELEDLKQQLNRLSDKNEDQKSLCNALEDAVSAFESFSKDIRDILKTLPAIPKRLKKISKINFQNFLDAAKTLSELFDFDLLRGLEERESLFINKSFKARHVITHNGAVVDEKYIEESGDSGVKVGQILRLKCSDIKKLLELLGIVGKNLFDDFESMFPVPKG